MCGIVGTNFFLKYFNKAVNKLFSRGPDNQDILIYKNNCFGHTRLSIIDLDAEANQPMEFDEIIIVFNGEIYNYKELIKEHNLKVVTKSDTEVLIRLYQKYDVDFLKLINGMFSFCIYDKKKRRFFCARDRFGKKPFYYYYKNGKFIFGSEIKAILSCLDKTPSMNNEAFYEYLSFMTPIHQNTFYKDIKKLQAGHYLILDNNLKIKKYYDIDKIETKYFDKNKSLSDIEDLLISSLKYRLVSDVKVASLLSGGVDSSFISALYAKIVGKIDTFSIGYDEYLHYSELDYAKIVAKHINSNHNEIVISKRDFLETIDKILEATDEPFGDSATIPTYILSQAIHKNGIKVALSGEGADENFLGYDNYFKMFSYYASTPKESEFNLTKDWEYNYRRLNNLPIYQTSGETFTEKQKKLLLKNYSEKFFIKEFLTNYTPVKWVSYIDFKIWIAEVLMTKIDRASMANSLEIRAPFLDFRLVEYMFQIDDELKKGDTNKSLLKQIAIKYLPQKIVYRQKKGFSSPFIEWLYDEYDKEILDTILIVNKEINIFNEEFVKFLFNEAKEKRFKQHIWQLFLFAKWFNKVYL
ncbi:asparagine synthase (glutamine-hydrolyzing) [Hydrogenimonas thermophila]|uniref:asparagine synthase (glutamine-hydrolyzing) n=1 Tax=Hydrogenimonas thermophila TaxID=223786 RepID=A0A1I5L2R9_9BACT|nr:asparagine synthase (glutamine-hydrolyzing) [Hydrogenimonas thermophila]SFO91640.1 asparagine synthase (glutamine-hydrolysing) [Hydrogenimonas thermophila]